ncbi:MAG: amidohydrolase family protein [Gammaproteobacteria bacterium]
MGGYRIFDSHLHIIYQRYPLTPNNGYLPNEFTCADYRAQTSSLNIVGGAIVSGSFQGMDQTYLEDALNTMGSGYVGVTNLAVDTDDHEILRLNALGIRAVRFNLKRGGSEDIRHLTKMAHRVQELAGWHIELYVDSSDLPELYDSLRSLPKITIDHLGLSKAGFDTLLRLVESGAYVKASGFSRTDLDISQAVKDVCTANPDALMFGTDLPSTRAPKPYADADLQLLIDALDPALVDAVLMDNAVKLYRPANA